MPLVGQEGWVAAEEKWEDPRPAQPSRKVAQPNLPQEIAAACEPFEAIETAALERLLARVGDARVVLLGEANTRHQNELHKSG